MIYEHTVYFNNIMAGGEGLLHSKPVQGLRLTNYITGFTPKSNQDRTSVSQPIETSVYFQLVRSKSSDIILSTLGLAQAYCAINLRSLPSECAVTH